MDFRVVARKISLPVRRCDISCTIMPTDDAAVRARENNTTLFYLEHPSEQDGWGARDQSVSSRSVGLLKWPQFQSRTGNDADRRRCVWANLVVRRLLERQSNKVEQLKKKNLEEDRVGWDPAVDAIGQRR